VPSGEIVSQRKLIRGVTDIVFAFRVRGLQHD